MRASFSDRWDYPERPAVNRTGWRRGWQDPRVHALGIDVGTTNAKVAIVSDDGTLRAAASRPIAMRRDGEVAEQDPADVWRAVVDATREAVAAAPGAAGDVGTVGCCSQYSSIVGVDERGEPTSPVVMYMDLRGTDRSLEILGRHPEAFETWVERHGIPTVGAGLSLAHLLHLEHDHPEVHARTVQYLEVMDYVNLRLTGTVAANQCTMFMSQLIDNRSLESTAYDEDLVRMAGVDPSRLPPLRPLDEPVGTLLPKAAEQLGIPAGAVVQAGINDSHAGALATDAYRPGRAGVMVGTTSVLLDTADHHGTDLEHEVLAMPGPLPGAYLVWAENGLGGKALEHVLEHVVHAVDELADHSVVNRFARLDEALESVPPGSRGVVFHPWLTGSVSPSADSHVRGAFLNLSLDSRRVDLVRAVVEGICHNLAWLLPYVEAFTGRSVDEVVFGGGAARSEVWAAILADVLDRPVSTLRDADQANARAVGLLALHRAGRLERGDLARLVETNPVHEPRAACVEAHRPLHQAFVDSFEALRPIYRTLHS
jgi:xylulokinase